MCVDGSGGADPFYLEAEPIGRAEGIEQRQFEVLPNTISASRRIQFRVVSAVVSCQLSVLRYSGYASTSISDEMTLLLQGAKDVMGAPWALDRRFMCCKVLYWQMQLVRRNR